MAQSLKSVSLKRAWNLRRWFSVVAEVATLRESSRTLASPATSLKSNPNHSLRANCASLFQPTFLFRCRTQTSAGIEFHFPEDRVDIATSKRQVVHAVGEYPCPFGMITVPFGMASSIFTRYFIGFRLSKRNSPRTSNLVRMFSLNFAAAKSVG
jgi:hypothetical protein